MTQRTIVLATLALLLAPACGGSDTKTLEPKLSVIQPQVFDISCALSSCHKGQRPTGDLNLEAPALSKLLVPAMEKPEKQLVVPGDPDASYLMDKLLDRNLPMSTTGDLWTSMPPGQPLDAPRLEAVRAWIAAGAMND